MPILLLCFKSGVIYCCPCLLASVVHCSCLQLSVIDMDILVGRSLANNMEKSYPLLDAAVRDVMFASMIAFSKNTLHISTEHYTSPHCG